MPKSQPEPPPKLFTVEEANRLLPQVKQVLAGLRQQRDRMEKLEKEMAVEELSWLQEDGTVSPRAKAELARLKEQQEEQTAEFGKTLEGLNRLGAQLKDLDQGLVDFFAARGRELVFLCWKEGEEEIRYWHDLESGFPGRRPLEEL